MDFETLLQQFMAHLAAAKSGPTYGGRGAGTKSPPMNGAGAPEQFRTVDDFTGAMGAQLDPVLQSPVLDGNPVVQAARMAGRMTGTSPGEMIGRMAPYTNPYTGIPAALSHVPEAAESVGNALADPSGANVSRAAIDVGMIPLTMTPGLASARGPLNALARQAPKVGMAVAGGGVGAGSMMAMSADAEAAKKRQKAAQTTAMASVAAPAQAPADPAFDKALADNPGLRQEYQALKQLEAQATAPPDPSISGTARKALLDQLAAARAAFQASYAKANEASLPWDQAHPEMAKNWPFIQALAPMAVGGTLAGFKTAGRVGRARTAQAAVNAAEDAWTSGQPDAFAYQAERLDSQLRAHNGPAGIGRAIRAVDDAVPIGPVMAGGVVGAEMRALPYQYNALMAPPGSDAQVQGQKNMLDPNVYLAGLGIGALSGMTGAHAVPKFGRMPEDAMQAQLWRRSKEYGPELEQVTRNLQASKAARTLASDVPPTPPSPGGTPPTSGMAVPPAAPRNALSRARGPQPPAVSGQSPSASDAPQYVRGKGILHPGETQYRNPKGRYGESANPKPTKKK